MKINREFGRKFGADYGRVLELAMREFETTVQRTVERAFEAALRTATDGVFEVPFIGEKLDSRAPEAKLAYAKELAVRALRCRKWFEFEAPLWAQPLPLKQEDCIALFNDEHQLRHRSRAVGEYGLRARDMAWDLSRIEPFEMFCRGRI